MRGRRDRIATPEEAAQLIAAAPAQATARCGPTALYAGLRRGELMALRWEDVDLAAGVIRVERSWDRSRGSDRAEVPAGKRTVPIAVVLRDHLVEHKLQHRARDRPRVRSLDDRALRRPCRSRPGLRKRGEQRASPITLHEARHTFASLMIAAGVNAKALSTYMGQPR